MYATMNWNDTIDQVYDYAYALRVGAIWHPLE